MYRTHSWFGNSRNFFSCYVTYLFVLKNSIVISIRGSEIFLKSQMQSQASRRQISAKFLCGYFGTWYKDIFIPSLPYQILFLYTVKRSVETMNSVKFMKHGGSTIEQRGPATLLPHPPRPDVLYHGTPLGQGSEHRALVLSHIFTDSSKWHKSPCRK